MSLAWTMTLHSKAAPPGAEVHLRGTPILPAHGERGSVVVMARARLASLRSPPSWIRPQLAQLVTEAPPRREWLHEIKYDGYRLHARLDRGKVQLLTRKGLDWTHKYPSTAAALAALNVHNAYIDGELCAVRPDGTTSFSGMQAASDSGGAGLVYFAFDLLFIDGDSFAELPLNRAQGSA